MIGEKEEKCGESVYVGLVRTRPYHSGRKNEFMIDPKRESYLDGVTWIFTQVTLPLLP